MVGRPVHFSGTKDPADDTFALDRLRIAFANAGFHDVCFLEEPVAAAYKYREQLDHDELALIADFGGGTSDFSLVKLEAKSSESLVIGTDGVGIAGDTFDSKLVRNLVAPIIGLGSRYTTQFGKTLTAPNWLYEHLERWHHLSFLKTWSCFAKFAFRPSNPRRSRLSLTSSITILDTGSIRRSNGPNVRCPTKPRPALVLKRER